MTPIQVRIDGIPLEVAAPYGEVTWSHGERGCREASFSIAKPKGWRHPLIRPGAQVDYCIGAGVLWTGTLVEPEWADMRFTAHGPASDAENYLAATGAYTSTSTPSVAIDRAIADGWNVTRDASVPTTALTTTSDGLVSTGALLDSSADELGQWWSIRADRVLRFEAMPTQPAWQLVSGVIDLGNATDDYVSALFVAYKTTGGSIAHTLVPDEVAAERYGYKEGPCDLTSLGGMTLARAQDFAAGLLAKGRSRVGWLQSAEVSADQILNPGGRPACLSMVRSLQTLRVPLYGHVTELYGQTYLDVMIGQTDHSADSATVTIAPVGKVAATFAEVQEQTLRLASGRAA